MAVDVPARRRTYLGWSLAATALFFLPLGVVALVYAMRSRDAWAAGSEELAAARARVARRWVVAAIVVGVLLDLALLGMLLALGAFPS